MSDSAIVMYFYSQFNPGYIWEMVEPHDVDAFFALGWKLNPAECVESDLNSKKIDYSFSNQAE